MATTLTPDDKTQEDHNPGQDEFDKIIDKNFSPGDEAAMEERAKDGAIDDNVSNNSDPQGGAGAISKPSEEKSVSDEKEKINEHEDQLGAGYMPSDSKNDKQSYLQGMWKRKKLLGGAGVFGSMIVVVFIIFLGFINVFKLDDMMSNIDAKTFARFNGVAERRSLAWMEAYMVMRLGDIGDNPNLDKGANSDNVFFRSERLRENPVTDWYKTLRTSKFEQEVFESHGFKFVSVRKADGTIRPGKITMNGKGVDINVSQSDFDKLAAGDTATIRKYQQTVDLQVFQNDKEARREIRSMVNDNLRFLDVVKRRHIRKDIQNMTGVRDWRFFEDARSKFDEKKINIRNKIVDKAVPDSTKSGKFIKCLFGISDCKFSEDPSSPENRAEGSIAGDDKNKSGTVDEPNPNDPNKPKTTSVDFGPAADIIKDLVNKVSAVMGGLNAVAFFDSLDSINTAVHNHLLSKGVSVARGTQAMGLYQVFETSRDQIKSGEVNSSEVNAFMRVVGPIASSEAWNKIILGHGDPSKLDSETSEKARKYCSQESQSKLEKNPSLASKDSDYQYAYLCPDKQIGSSSTASVLEEGYNKTIGTVIAPLMSVYQPLRHSIIGDIAGFLNGVISSLTSTLTDAVIKTLGLGDEVQSVSEWLATNVAKFLGAGPIMTGNEPAGVFSNWLVQGGAYTAEAVMRAQGGAATTDESRTAAIQSTDQYQAAKDSSMSSFERYLSLSNTDSPASKSLLAISTASPGEIFGKITNISLLLKTISSGILAPFSGHSSAQNVNGYAAAKLSGIRTMDMPPECSNYPVLEATPQNGTNIQQILPGKVPDSELTWDLVKDTNQWYDYVYDKIGDVPDPDSIALKIYNCNLFENATRGGIGNLYGYDKDNGLEDSSSGSNSQSPGSSGGLPAGSAKQLASQLKNYVSSGKIQCLSSGCPDIVKTASGTSIKNSSCYVDALDPSILGMLLKLAQDGHSFILSAVCTDHPSNPTSFHHKGKAVDFNTIDGVFMGPDDVPWDNQKLAAGKKLDQDIAAFMPKTTGFGQEGGRCHTHFDFLNGFSNLFDDACHHQHIQVP